MRARRLALLGIAVALAVTLSAPSSSAAAGGAAAQKLAARYVPIAMLREETDPPCETSAEQYQPTSVGTVLGNPTVTLEREEPDGKLLDVTKAPSAADVAGLPEGYYLNLPGTPLGDTCIYAKDFKRLLGEGKAPAVAYAHIAREPGHSGFVLQYWFFWYFNQFNDLHEGDWEGMQITFEGKNPAAALNEEPSEIILFQHAGGERADWEDGKVQKEGTHPVVYPAAGSHATFYDSAVYVENGQEGSGVGCDNTSEPLRELRLEPVLLPEAAPEQGRFQWLSYEGRWGEREKGYNNGPTGPVTKTVWSEPFAWMADQRTTSPRLPGGSIVGPQVTGAFCGAVATASDLINLDAKSRAAAIATIVIALLAIALFVGLTRWGPVDLERLRARRSFGQLVRAARRLYGRHWKVLVPTGLAAFPLVGGANYLAGLLATNRGADSAAGRSGVNLAFGDLVESFARPVTTALVAAAVVVFVRLLVEAQPTSVRGVFAALRGCFWRVVGAQLLVILYTTLLAITVIGFPVAVFKYVAWSFAKEEVVFGDKKVRESLRGSSELVRGHWWHTLRVVAFLFLVSIVTGPALSFALIFTHLSLIWINLIGSFVFALLIPYVALGETLLYFDLQARGEEEPVPRRRLRLRRPSPAPSS